MFRIKLDDFTVDFGPLIIFLIIVCVLIVGGIIFSRIQNTKILKACMYGDYEYAIGRATRRLIKIQQHKPIGHTIKIVDFLSSCLAISYFSKDDDENFLNNINKINKNRDIQNLWLSLYFLRRDEIDAARTYYSLLSIETKKKYDDLLEGIILYKTGEKACAIEKLRRVYPNLNYAVLREWVGSYLSEKDSYPNDP